MARSDQARPERARKTLQVRYGLPMDMVKDAEVVDEGPTMEKLSQILWRERELLETLLFKLEQEQTVLASGRTRWLSRAAREVEDVLATIRETEILRAVAADEAAASIGLEHNPSLRALAAAAGEPWQDILRDHHEAFVAITQEVAALADANRSLITAGYQSARETLMTMGDDPDGYGADGAAVVVSDHRQRLVDWSL
jgi:flagellar biosynthesis/type III secretory pathway chaperone